MKRDDEVVVDHFASDDEKAIGSYRTCIENGENERFDDSVKSRNAQSGRSVILDENDGDGFGGRKKYLYDKQSPVHSLSSPNSDNDFRCAEFSEDDSDSYDSKFKVTGYKSSFRTPRVSSKNRLNSEHQSGNQQRRRRVIQDDEESICIDETLEDTSYHEDDNKEILGTSMQDNCETFLSDRLKEIRLSSDPAKKSECSLRTVSSDVVAVEAKGAWTLGNDDYYTLSNKSLSQADFSCVEWPNYQITIDLYKKLYDHQKFGVQWLVSLYAKGTGGILGDDMGLGKTFMTLTLLGGLMKGKTIRNALVLCPVSLLRTWENEARKVLIAYLGLHSIVISVISSEMDRHKRAYMLEKAMACSKKRPHLIISTYGLLTSNPSDLTPQPNNVSSSWNYVILDEGHKIKNPSTQVNKACHQIAKSPNTSRLLLTGTPIQNNLVELWTLFDWATSGRLLGRKSEFLKKYAEPIERGRDKNSNETTLKIAEKANELLQDKLKGCFLQRLKKDVFSTNLPTKRDLVVWTHLSEKQRTMYEKFVTAGTEVDMLLNGEKKSPLEALTYLKKLCGHPTLVSKTDAFHTHGVLKNISAEQLLQESKKLQALLALITSLTQAGHRILIFSQSTRMLDIIQRVLVKVALMSRIDGSTKERDRQRLVDDFNNPNSRYGCMLLSTKAGGLGLTLTGADRAIIYDPSWNPAEDSQAVDRCYRIGTTKPVTIYRLVAAGTVEERMYEKQVFKEGIRRTLLDSKGAATDRYFCREDLKRLFTLSPTGQCEMLERIRVLDNGHPPTSPTEVGGTLRLLEKHPSIVGLSSHDSLYCHGLTDSSNRRDMPFNGTPAKQHRIEDGQDENFMPLGRQLGLLNKSRRNREKSKIDKKDHPTEKQTITDIDYGHDRDSKIDLENTFPTAELPTLEKQMEGLLNSLESQNTLAKTERIAVHRKISHLARDLGWL